MFAAREFVRRLPGRLTVCAALILSAACSTGGDGGGTPPPAAVAPSITQQPTAQVVWAPAAATFTVQATGTEPLEYRWSRNGTVIPGATLSSFNTGPTSIDDHAALFQVEVKNAQGARLSTAVQLSVNQIPFVTQQPDDVVTVEGQSVTFTARGQGTPVLQYQWKRNEVVIPGATAPTYNIPSVTRVDNLALFSAVITNSLGTVTTRQASLQVGAQVSAPVITQQPLGGTAVIGQTVTFNVAALGTPPLQYQWRKNGTTIAGATQASFVITNLQASHAGAYSVVVSNPGGTVTSSDAVLVVDVSLPSITTQPADVWTGTGQTATFSVVAAGSPPMQYQWKKNGVDIPGATLATYVTPVAVIADNGTTFQVRITNPAGSILSIEAVLHVFQARTVAGVAGTFWQVESGQTFVPRDLRTTPVSALQLGGTNEFDVFPGAGGLDGTFQVAGLPPGPFMMLLGASGSLPAVGVWIIQGDPDFRDTAMGRTDRTIVTGDQTNLAVNVTGPLRSLTQGIWIYFPTLGLMKTANGTGPVYRFPWKGLPLATASWDSLWALGPKTTTVLEGELTTLASAVGQTAPSMKAIGETLVDVQPVAQSTLPGPGIGVRTADYAAQLAKVHPALDPLTGRGALKVTYGAQPAGGTLGPVLPWAPIFNLVRSNPADLPVTTFTCADPFPVEWTRAFQVRQEFTFDLPLADGASPLKVQDAFEDFWQLEQVHSTPLTQQIRPVVQARINGGEFFAPTLPTGLAPLLTWQLQVPDVPSYVKVTVFQVIPEEGRLQEKISYMTTIASQKITPGILETGKRYVFRLQTVRSGSHDPSRPFLPSWPMGTAPVYSGIVTP